MEKKKLLALLAACVIGLAWMTDWDRREAHASATSFPDYGSMLSLSGSAIVGSGSAYATGTTFYPAGATRLSIWVQIVLDSGTNLTSGVNVQFTCGYNASSDVTMPVTYSDQATPTVNTTTTLTGTAGATVWHLLQTGAITGAKAGCRLQVRSANASAGVSGDQVVVYVYGY